MIAIHITFRLKNRAIEGIEKVKLQKGVLFVKFPNQKGWVDVADKRTDGDFEFVLRNIDEPEVV